MPIVKATGIYIERRGPDDREADQIEAELTQAILAVHAEHALDGRWGSDLDNPDDDAIKSRMQVVFTKYQHRWADSQFR